MDLVEPEVLIKDGWHFEFKPFILSQYCQFTIESGMSLLSAEVLPV